MQTGWAKPFEVDRLIHQDEHQAMLPRKRIVGVDPFPWSALVRFNSTYADFIDRRYRLRGMVETSVGIFGGLFMGLLGALLVGFFVADLQESKEAVVNIIGIVGMLAITVASFWAFWHYKLRHDLFTHTHYPIRFNRRTRKVHVFRHNGPDGVLTVPFDEVFWHVGSGLQHTFLRDVRGHVMDGNRIRDTFTVGHYFDDSQPERIAGLWEFIRRYMDEDPGAVAEHPLDRCIDLSMTPSWTNCYLWAAASMGATFQSLRFVLFFLYYPVVGVLTLGRWLTLNSCKPPRWPAEIEAESQVAADDPHRWDEPTTLWEFAKRPGMMERERERMRQLQQAQARL